jgi:hypothetical protein
MAARGVPLAADFFVLQTVPKGRAAGWHRRALCSGTTMKLVTPKKAVMRRTAPKADKPVKQIETQIDVFRNTR